ncbi:hypothetical protein [Paenibacillus sp.]|nr:hypothetical protein [Paenibacillus sp.]
MPKSESSGGDGIDLKKRQRSPESFSKKRWHRKHTLSPNFYL